MNHEAHCERDQLARRNREPSESSLCFLVLQVARGDQQKEEQNRAEEAAEEGRLSRPSENWPKKDHQNGRNKRANCRDGPGGAGRGALHGLCVKTATTVVIR